MIFRIIVTAWIILFTAWVVYKWKQSADIFRLIEQECEDLEKRLWEMKKK